MTWICSFMCLSFMLSVTIAFFQSIADLNILVSKEQQVSFILDDAVRTGWEPPEQVDRIRDIFNSHVDPDTNAIAYSSPHVHPSQHPIDALLTVKSWLKLKEQLNGTTPPVKNQIRQLNVPWPTEEDYIGALRGLLRLQKTYLLPTDEVATGLISGCPSRANLQADDMYELGKVAITLHHKMAFDWFMEALNKKENLSQAAVTDAYVKLSEIFELKRDLSMSFMMARNALKSDPDSVAALSRQQHLSKRPAMGHTATIAEFWQNEQDDPETTQWYDALCRGLAYKNRIWVDKTLQCLYKQSSTVPYLRYKEEIQLFYPRISLFRDVISSSEATAVQELVYSRLNTSLVQGRDGRVSKRAWPDTEQGILYKLSRRVQDITGLDTASAEPFEINNYGPVGQHKLRHDYLGLHQNEGIQFDYSYTKLRGIRMATFKYLWGDVKDGGATVFPKIKVRVPWVKYSAAFWYNLWPSGGGDRGMLHADCPLLIGQTWVSNKWIPERGRRS